MTSSCQNENRVVILGAGPAALLAAWSCRAATAPVLVLEGQSEFSKKLLLTGNGRCNLGRDLDLPSLLTAYPEGSAFLRPALSQFGSAELRSFFEDEGFPLQIEEGQRLYPKSQKARDVRNFLLGRLRRAGAELRKNAQVLQIQRQENDFLLLFSEGSLRCRQLIVAIGACSFPQTGSDGALWPCLEALGLKINPPQPALTALPLRNPESDLAGLTLPNVVLTYGRGRSRCQAQGSLLFTHQGISGPAVLDLSCQLPSERPLCLNLQLAADYSSERLEAAIIQCLTQNEKKEAGNLPLPGLPLRFVPHFLRTLGLDPHKAAAGLRKQAPLLLRGYARFPLELGNAPRLESAYACRGGVDLKAVNPRTLAAKELPGLFFAGEVLDYIGLCGGYNLQAAWATGHLAGQHAAQAWLSENTSEK